MAGTLGRVEEFDGNKDDWQQYVERLEHLFQANDVGAEKKRAVFLSVIGSATYKILRNLLSPAKPGEKSQPQVNRTGATPSKSGQSVPTCYRCGIRGHTVSKCRVDKNIICHYCQKRAQDALSKHFKPAPSIGDGRAFPF